MDDHLNGLYGRVPQSKVGAVQTVLTCSMLCPSTLITADGLFSSAPSDSCRTVCSSSNSHSFLTVSLSLVSYLISSLRFY